MNLALQDSDLRKYYNNEEIIRLTALQVIKDFSLFGLQIEFPEDIQYAYTHLYPQLVNEVSVLLDRSNTKLLSILYQIDIPEKVIRNAAESMPDKALAEVITELILNRELKKVLTRIYFKQQFDSGTIS